MRKLALSLGSGRQAAAWHPAFMTVDQIWDKIDHPIRTAETNAQYWKMTRNERETVKDKGAFVGGTLKGTRRKKEEVVSRSMVTMDYDKLTPDFFDSYEETHRYFTLLYSTHSHLPDAPRARVLIPLTRDVTPEEYNAIVRFLAAEISMTMIDICSFKINQLMFWPSCSSDGEYIHRRYEGEWLDPDAFLAAHPNWRDYSSLPTAPGEKDEVNRQHKLQEDPLKKTGIVGAVCRTYSPRDGIAKFLSHLYAPSAVEGRLDYIPGEGSAGVIIYEDRYIYSHHATDPAGGRLLNIFDLVRLHLFGNEDEKTSFIKACQFFENDEPVKETLAAEKAAQAKEDFKEISSSWEEPVPFGRHTIMPFPLDALPPAMRDYTAALSESVQTPVDMAGCSVLSVIATSIQGKYMIQGKPDWIEPLNIYQTVIAPPSERKSAIQHATIRPVSDHENRENQLNAAAIESSRMQRRVLERRLKAKEEQLAKGNIEQDEVDQLIQELTQHREKKPLRLFADDITPEKLASVLSENDGRMALLSSEAGIFDTLAGAYSSKGVNIDVMLKSYSGDQIRVDRIGRESENIMHPTLTVLLMAQPNVISKVLSNETFRGRGLTARFLYSMPVSAVGSRQYRSKPVPQSVYAAYERQIFDMLQDEYSQEPELITLSAEADKLLENFSRDLEPKLVKEYAEIADWCGKLVGNVLRIAGLLCRAAVFRGHEFLDEPEPLVVDGQTMKNAIRLGKYFLNHAQAVFNVLPENAMFQNAHRILKMLQEKGLKEFNRRTAMRNCQIFKRVEEIQPVLDFLEDYGYIASVPVAIPYAKGRPPMPSYIVNPWVEQYYCHFDITSVMTASDKKDV